VFSADARCYPFFEEDASAIFVGNVAGALVATFYMAIVNKMFLSPLRMHKDWGERSGIFESKPKSVASSVNPKVISISVGEKRGSFSVADELLKWAKLKEDGHLTEEQYNKSLHLFTRQYAQRRLLGGIDWSGCSSIWHAQYAENESDADLPTDQKPASGPASSGTYETVEHWADSTGRRNTKLLNRF
jgi:hypothetical protein